MNEEEEEETEGEEEYNEKEFEIDFTKKEIVYEKEGDYGNGNLYIYIHPKVHSYYQIENEYNLHINHYISIREIQRIIERRKEKEENKVYLVCNTEKHLSKDEKWYIEISNHLIDNYHKEIIIENRGLYKEDGSRGNLKIEFILEWNLLEEIEVDDRNVYRIEIREGEEDIKRENEKIEKW